MILWKPFLQSLTASLHPARELVLTFPSSSSSSPLTEEVTSYLTDTGTNPQESSPPCASVATAPLSSLPRQRKRLSSPTPRPYLELEAHSS